MWVGYETQLAAYSAIVCREWRKRGFRDTLLVQFLAVWQRLAFGHKRITYPHWFGDPDFHASHRSNLLRKDFDYYTRFGWTESPNLPYAWPV